MPMPQTYGGWFDIALTCKWADPDLRDVSNDVIRRAAEAGALHGLESFVRVLEDAKTIEWPIHV